jgi:aspartyl aminopeptidase
MNNFNYSEQLTEFIKNSPTSYHAVDNMKKFLNSAGFESLNENESWCLKSSKGYYVTRNDSSIIAFIIGAKEPIETGIRLIGAHTDSPCLKIKPNPEIHKKTYLQLGVEVYGGVLLNTWFDRDLSVAGKVTYRTKNNELDVALIDIKKPIAVIPSLAIHLNRDANKGYIVNPETDMRPILTECHKNNEDFRDILAKKLVSQLSSTSESNNLTVIDYDLSFYDTQPPGLIGLKKEFISSARLDNLLSCFAGVQAITKTNKKVTSMLACYDHEEVGSTSAIGANGAFMESVLNRLFGQIETKSRVVANSMLISTDNAHGVHPNFLDKHDENHSPVINNGLVIKVNANQRYATDSLTSSLLKNLCNDISIPTQSFVNRADMSCGSTIGPISAANIGIKTIDIGVPTFAMHSIREVAGKEDAFYLFQMLSRFLDTEKLQ